MNRFSEKDWKIFRSKIANWTGIAYKIPRTELDKRSPEKDYWTEAVVFIMSNNSFGPTEISYLENRFCNLCCFERKSYLSGR